MSNKYKQMLIIQLKFGGRLFSEVGSNNFIYRICQTVNLGICYFCNNDFSTQKKYTHISYLISHNIVTNKS